MPRQNEVVERKILTIVYMMRSMLHVQNLNKPYWAEPTLHADYTHNQCPTRVLPPMTPKEAWSKRTPYMGVFICITYAMVPVEKRIKFDAKELQMFVYWLLRMHQSDVFKNQHQK